MKSASPIAFLLIALCVSSLPARAQEARYALITHNNTPVMAGPNKPDAELMKVGSGQVVQYLGETNGFGKVKMPGGVVAYVAKGRASQPYVAMDTPGEARVLVSRLKIRPQPNLDWPAMGTLEPNDRLLVLGEAENGWLKILAPSSQAVYIFKDYLKLDGDQAALATTFANSDQLGRTQLLAAGNISSEVVAKIEAAGAADAKLKEAESRMAAHASGEKSAASLADLEKEYETIAATAPEGSLARTTAEERLAYIRDRRAATESYDEARRRIAELEKERAVRDSRYQKELASFRERKEREMAEPKPADSRFLQYGIGELHRVFIGESQRPSFVIAKGLENRYVVTSERYDLSEYHGKTIGITGWEKLDTPKGKDLQRIEITRMEVMH